MQFFEQKKLSLVVREEQYFVPFDNFYALNETEVCSLEEEAEDEIFFEGWHENYGIK